jgi:N-acetyl-beta-hexosaminidase
MLDVSRTFFDIDVLYKYINWLSYHKINKLHLHLTDDNGWRIEIKNIQPLQKKELGEDLMRYFPQHLALEIKDTEDTIHKNN